MNSSKILLSSISPSVPIILASGSESRRVMLEDAGLDFNVFSSDVDEDILKQEMVGLPFEEQVVQNTLADIRRQGDEAQRGIAAQAVGSGAFGGSRGQIAQSELDRNVMKQQADTAAQMRAAGFQNAQQAAMNAFESGMGRQQQLGQLTGQIGAGLGSLGAQTGALGQQLGGLGIQQAGLGEMGTNLNTQDIQNLMTTGATERGVNQAGLDALRLTNLQRYTQPYQQYGFLSDIYSGTPTGSSTLTAASAPQVSPFQTAMGLGISGLAAASGAQRAGLF